MTSPRSPRSPAPPWHGSISACWEPGSPRDRVVLVGFAECHDAAHRGAVPADRSLRRHGGAQIGRRYQHAESFAPDDHALVFAQIDARRNRIALAPLEGAQAAEIDEH